ncbi:Ysc83p Ecym_2748 [Eremothecium cymbalariae DBVPG|uniref:DUF1776-domain-containing protein n=1 Tax=Eremothecium cymbalariae (strain CBS 270.75 / DBVPG 7215 / KCTC 17166 / NRRL Y-17582) TaxID=931890 RepID=G8JPY4_ERECY|nr:Hypothetical protein Ecym_2748 [Eremothecium cymbalariae DBVPG\
MSDWWLNACFDAYDKARQTIEEVGVSAAESASYVYAFTKDAWKEIAIKGNKGNGEGVMDVDRVIRELSGTAAPDAFERYHGFVFEKVVGISQNRVVRFGLGVTALGVLLFAVNKFVIPELGTHIENDREVVLVVGEMSDPITRSLVYDLYRRGFIVFICTTKQNKHQGLEEEEYEKVPSPWDKEDGLFHITSSTECLSQFMEFLQQENKHLRGILVVPNVCFYTSGIFTNITSAQLSDEFGVNFVNIWRVITNLLPQFNNAYRDKLQVIIFNPSLSKNLNIQYHSLEFLISSMMETLYNVMKNECGHLADVYQCHLGILNVAGNASNYKYLTINGEHITTSLCEPIYELLISKGHIWFRFKRWVLGSVLYCGKGSRIACWFKNLAPVWLLELL